MSERDRVLEEAAQIADAFAKENFLMATDSILLDPVLRKPRGWSTEADWRASEGHQADGLIHSSMAHAAQNIAAAIRAATHPKTEDRTDGTV